MSDIDILWASDIGDEVVLHKDHIEDKAKAIADERRKGVRAAFNFFMNVAANTDEDERAIYLCDMASGMLEDVDPSLSAKWSKICDMRQIITEKDREIERLNHMNAALLKHNAFLMDLTHQSDHAAIADHWENKCNWGRAKEPTDD